MIKTRLVRLLSHAKKYIVYTILWQWAALLSQVLAVFTIADLLECVVYRAVTVPVIERTILILILVVIIRFPCEQMGARSSYLACVDVKRILREKIYDKMLKLGASYSEQVSSSEVVQVSTEGVEQLETYFGKYLPQDYHEGTDYAAQFHKRDGHCSIWWCGSWYGSSGIRVFKGKYQCGGNALYRPACQ